MSATSTRRSSEVTSPCETTTLLATDLDCPPSENDVETWPGQKGLSDGWGSSETRMTRYKVGFFCAFLTITLGIQCMAIPLGRIIETAVCYGYWKEHDPGKIPASGQVPETMCKIRDVQTLFATVQGYWLAFYSLSSALFSIPFGSMAKRFGRKSMLAINAIGYAINVTLLFLPLYSYTKFSARTIWLSPLSWCIGGGPVFLYSTLWNMAANMSTDSEQAVTFLRLGMFEMGGIFLAGTVSSGLMTISPWIPVTLGSLLVAIGLCTVMVILPGSSGLSHSSSLEATDDSGSYSCNGTANNNSDNPDPCPQPLQHPDSPTWLKTGQAPSTDPGQLKFALPSKSPFAIVQRVINPYAFLASDYRIWLVLPGFFVFEFYSREFTMQYLSVRFGWTLARAGFILSFQPGINISFLLFGLPLASKWLNFYLSPHRSNLYLARFSITCFAISMFCVGIASSLPVLMAGMFFHAAGAGYMFLFRAIITVLVKESEVAQLYTVIEVLRSIGGVIGISSITSLFKLGLEIGGAGIGLPWLAIGVLFTIVGLGVWAMPLHEQ